VSDPNPVPAGRCVGANGLLPIPSGTFPGAVAGFGGFWRAPGTTGGAVGLGEGSGFLPMDGFSGRPGTEPGPGDGWTAGAPTGGRLGGGG
jgi:hypothetical protein